MNILLLENYPNIKRKYLKYLEKKHNIFELEDDYENDKIDVLIIRSKIKVDKNLLNQYSNLKYIARVGVGLDKIDLKECEKRNIKVLNTPGANANAVADLVLAGVLNLARKLNIGFKGIENRFDYMGFELESKVVGIVGFGNIGRKIYTRFKAFGVKNFLIFDPFLKKEDVEKNEFCHYLEKKEDLFKNADIISFHIPLLDATRNFLGEKEFKLLKSNVLLVNTSRGGIIDENELIKFLKENENASFFADVWEEEPLPPKQTLLKLPNVIITPHIGAMTEQAEEKMHYFKELDI